MQSIENRVKKLKDKKKDPFKTTIYILCKHFGWDYWTLMKQPIPFVWAMIDELIRECKQQKEMMEKNKKKRRR